MAELADEQFISYREGARLRELLSYAAHRAGFEPQIKLESNESERIRRLVARGMGVAILPRSDADRSAGRRRRRRADRAVAETRHHARVARGPAAVPGRGRVPASSPKSCSAADGRTVLVPHGRAASIWPASE